MCVGVSVYELEAEMRTSADIAGLLAQYIKGQPEERLVTAAAYPDIFTSDVVEELNGAYALLLDAQRQAREACCAVDDVTREHGLPTALRITPKEQNELDVTEEMMIKRFAEEVAVYLSEGGAPNISSDAEPTSVLNSHCVDLRWHQHSTLVLHVLSYLPLEFTLSVAENVCKGWREWLFIPEFSGMFWHECTMREYPECVRMLLLSGGEDTRQCDWRTFAMLCCSVDEEDMSGEGDAES